MFLLAGVQMILHYLGWGGIVLGVVAILFSNPERGFELIIGGVIFLVLKYVLGFLFIGAKVATAPRQNSTAPVKKEPNKVVLKKKIVVGQKERDLFNSVIESVIGLEYSYDDAGKIAALMGDVDTAQDVMNRCMDDEKYSCALDIATQLGDKETAESALELIEEGDYGVTTGVGMAAAENGFKEKAKESLELNKDDDPAILGFIASRIGDKVTATKAIDKVMAKNSGKKADDMSARISLSCAGEIAITIGDKVRAKKVLDTFIKQKNYSYAGEIAAGMGDVKTAREMMEKCKADYDHNAVGRIAAMIGDFDETEKSINQELKNGDGRGAVRPTLEYLEYLARTQKHSKQPKS